MTDAERKELPEDKGIRAEVQATATLVAMAFRADARLAAATIGLSAANGFALVLAGASMKRVVDAVTAQHWTRAIWAVVITGACSAAQRGLGALLSSALDPLREKTQAAVQQEVLALTAAAPTVELHERSALRDRVDLLSNDGWRVIVALSNVISAASILTTFVGAVLLVASVSPLLLLVLAPLALSRYVARRTVAITRAAEEATVEPDRRAWHLFWLATDASPGKDVRTFGLQREIVERQLRLRLEVNAVRDRATVKASALASTASAASNLAYIGAVAYAAHLAMHGRATVGDVYLTLSQASMIAGCLDALIGIVTNLTENLVTMRRFRWLRTYVAEALAEQHAGTAPVPDRIVRGITLEGVDLTYAAQGDGQPRAALAGVDLFLPAGSVVALVGDNGAGKTSLVKVLTGMYHPTGGTIRVDDADLADLPIDGWRTRCAAAFQDHTHWELPLREVVGLGDVDRMDDDTVIRTALERGGGNRVLEELGGELDAPIGRSMPGGRELSGGQWQSLSLSRAMARDEPLLLVLDEPTSALDAAAEHDLFERFTAAARSGTRGGITLLVSHRFSTVRSADLIVVVEGGRVVETGPHDELMAAGGTYAELFSLQAAAYGS